MKRPDIAPRLVGTAEELAAEWKARARAKGEHSRFLQGPAWSLLLALYICRARGLEPAATTVSYDVEIPISTCLRWIRQLARAGLVSSRIDDLDTRVRRVGLTDEGVILVSAHLERAHSLVTDA